MISFATGVVAKRSAYVDSALQRFASLEIQFHLGAIRVVAEDLPGARASLLAQFVFQASRVEARLVPSARAR